MGKGRLDWQAIGLDVGVEFAKWLTGSENLHYGLWTRLEVTATNFGAAQAAYTDKLFSYLPKGSLSILDVGGGAGVTAKKLIALGNGVEIVVPSHILANRCRVNAPKAVVHETTFEAFETRERFDLCLFSESFQYIPLETALNRALELTKPGGHILIADCFRSKDFAPERRIGTTGGGHPLAKFQESVASLPVEQLASEDITEAVAPSIDLEQAFYHVVGTAITRIDDELSSKRPKTRWVLGLLLRHFLGERRRSKLNARLRGGFRTSEVFIRNNRYIIVLLRRI